MEKALSKMRDRVFDGYAIRTTGTYQGCSAMETRAAAIWRTPVKVGEVWVNVCGHLTD